MADNGILKNIASLFRTAVGRDKKLPFTSAVIVAAGNSERMEGINKQFYELAGMPVLARTIRAFQLSECISEIIVVTRNDDIGTVKLFCEKYGFDKVTKITEGGTVRQRSVWEGFRRIDEKSEFVAIHDGARCLITPDEITKVCFVAYEYGAASASTFVNDTVKFVRAREFIDLENAVDRDKIRLAQTPQVFGCNIYRAAAYTALDKNIFVTDDNALVERIKYNVKLVECSRYNIKITTPDDILFAEQVLAARAAGNLKTAKSE